MKRGRTTGKPTKAEEARIVACKEGPCIACRITAKTSPFPLCMQGQNDYHHLKSGNIRRGHRFGIGLCGWHHRGLTFGQASLAMRRIFGPSLMDGSRLFHETYGSDDELLAMQDELIGWKDE